MSTPNRSTTSPVGLPTTLRVAGIWLIWVTWAQISGWGLSAVGALHAVGYLSLLPILVILCVFFWHKTSSHPAPAGSIAKLNRRLRSSPTLLAWCAVSALVLISAAAHSPTNYDGITYRLPRLLYWLQENQWHWINGLDHRQNVSGLGHEWMIAPFIAITRSDRSLFLINFIPFLLLPGLFFITSRGLGIRTRVAKWWMWVWPMAYGVTLQAGSIGNDLLPMALAMAALAFTAQAKRSHPALCLFFAALAAAAMTGAKATSIPLALPIGIYWLWVAFQTVRLQGLVRIVASAMPLAIPSSIIPLAVACIIHTGHWAGNPGNRYGAQAGHPVSGIVGNSFQIASGLVQPPVFPQVRKVNERMQSAADEYAWYQWARERYPLFNLSLGGEIPMEEHSGVGIAITFLLLLSLMARITHRKRYAMPLSRFQGVIVIASLISLMAFMSKMGTGGCERLSLPYIPIAFLCVLFGLRNQPPHRPILAHTLQVLPAACLLPTLLLNPNRPLLPLDHISTHLELPASFQQRISDVYSTYQNRALILSPLLEGIPPQATIGFAGGGNHSSLGLFKPYGSRTIINLTPESTRKVDWIVATRDGFQRRMRIPMEDCNAISHFEKTNEMQIVSLVAVGPETWFVYKRTIN